MPMNRRAPNPSDKKLSDIFEGLKSAAITGGAAQICQKFNLSEKSS
jgi:hypothetical protein